MMKVFLIFFFGLALVSSAFAKPNIVLIVADDMGWSDAGCYGSEIRTPAIDSLARQGCLNTRCYTTPRCSPSRASLLTGKYPQSVGVGHLDKDLGKPGYRGSLSADVETLPEVLKKNGYRTYMSGKWHLGSGSGKYPWDRGFDRYWGLLSGANGYFKLDEGREMAEDSRPLTSKDLPKDFYMTKAITRKALDYLRDAEGNAGQPFFLYVAYTAPHTPLEASRETIASYKGKYSKGFEAVRQARLQKQRKLGIVPSSCTLPPDRKLPDKTTEKEDLKMAIYAAQITDMDEGISQILHFLGTKNMRKNTVVIFVSDNGATVENPARNYEPWPGLKLKKSGYGEHWAAVSNTPYRGHKAETYEGGVSVPCIVSYPGKVPSGKIFHEPVRFIDIMPTLLDWAGIKTNSLMDGSSLSADWARNKKPHAPWMNEGGGIIRPFFCEHEKNRAVLSRDFKLVSKGNKNNWELYRLNDRLESEDLSASKPEVVRQLQDAYGKWAGKNNVDETITNYYPPSPK